MFEGVGITEEEEAVYAALIERPGATLNELSTATGFPKGVTGRVLESLEEKRFLSQLASQPRRYNPAPPEVAVEALALRRQESIERARLAANAMAERLREIERAEPKSPYVEVARGRDAVLRWCTHILDVASSDMAVFDRPPYTSAPREVDETQVRKMAQGIVWRGVYAREVLEAPGELEKILEVVQLGEQARVAENLPMKIAIADGRLAYMPVDFESEEGGAIIVHPSPLLEGLKALFEAFWQAATPLAPSQQVNDVVGSLSPSDQEILSMLAAGMKDQTIAQRLDVSQRTVERRIQNILTELGVRTRFQAGLQAALRGWLRGVPKSSETG